MPSPAAAVRITSTSRSALASSRRIKPTTPASIAVTRSPSSSCPITSTARLMPFRCTLRSWRSVSSSSVVVTTTATSARSRSSASTSWISGRTRNWLTTPAREIGSLALIQTNVLFIIAP